MLIRFNQIIKDPFAVYFSLFCFLMHFIENIPIVLFSLSSLLNNKEKKRKNWNMEVILNWDKTWNSSERNRFHINWHYRRFFLFLFFSFLLANEDGKNWQWRRYVSLFRVPFSQLYFIIRFIVCSIRNIAAMCLCVGASLVCMCMRSLWKWIRIWSMQKSA